MNTIHQLKTPTNACKGKIVESINEFYTEEYPDDILILIRFTDRTEIIVDCIFSEWKEDNKCSDEYPKQLYVRLKYTIQ